MFFFTGLYMIGKMVWLALTEERGNQSLEVANAMADAMVSVTRDQWVQLYCFIMAVIVMAGTLLVLGGLVSLIWWCSGLSTNLVVYCWRRRGVDCCRRPLPADCCPVNCCWRQDCADVSDESDEEEEEGAPLLPVKPPPSYHSVCLLAQPAPVAAPAFVVLDLPAAHPGRTDIVAAVAAAAPPTASDRPIVALY